MSEKGESKFDTLLNDYLQSRPTSWEEFKRAVDELSAQDQQNQSFPLDHIPHTNC